MDVTSFGHSCLLLEYSNARILIDPGSFSKGFESLTDLDAILVTHTHPDHLDPERFADLVGANPSARIWAEPSVAKELSDGSSDAASGGAIEASALAAGDSIEVGGVTIAGAGGKHAIIYKDLPQVGNVGMIFTAEGEPTLFHPGDSLDAVPSGVDVLGVPISAPWCAAKETIEFVRAVGAERAIPIHDKVASDLARPIFMQHIGNFGGSEMIEVAGEGKLAL